MISVYEGVSTLINFFPHTIGNWFLKGDIHLGRGSSHELVQASELFSQMCLSTKKATPNIREIEGSANF